MVMKKIVFLGLLGLGLVACSEKKETVEPIVESNTMLEEPVTASVEETGGNEGQKLIEGADCLGCHKTDTKLVGPSYQEVADRYTEADVDMLADKIINGGQGNWGEIPMTPHAGLSKDNAKKMVQYILSLKK